MHKNGELEFSVITPSCNNLEYLKNCVKSVSDQDVELEHIVIDGVSTDGTVEFLKNNDQVTSIIEKDKGMYHALNKGLRIANAGIIGHLNCDEQYLPGTLKLVKNIFSNNPDIDIVHGYKININNDGSFNSFKKSYKLKRNHLLLSYNYAHTCATFYRKRIFDDGCFFDNTYKYVGDTEFIIRLLDNNYSTMRIDKYLSVFVISGSNLNQSSKATIERERLLKEKKFDSISNFQKKLTKLSMVVEKTLKGFYSESFPLRYNIYLNNDNTRTEFIAKEGSSKTKW